MEKFQRCSDDRDECCYSPCSNFQPKYLYRSRYARKVRVDMWVQKSGCYSTMGPPKEFCVERPEYFLKKYSGAPPVFFDRLAFRDCPRELEQRVADATCEERRRRFGLCQTLPRVCRGERDFIYENALHVIRMPHRRLKRCYINDNGCGCQSHLVDLSDAPLVLQPGFGRVPEYINRRKWELYCEDLQLKREMDETEIPPNYRVMDNCERSYLINRLNTRWNQLSEEYCGLPSENSDWVDQEKCGLEKQFQQIEGDLNVLNTDGPLLVCRDPYTQNPEQESQGSECDEMQESGSGIGHIQPGSPGPQYNQMPHFGQMPQSGQMQQGSSSMPHFGQVQQGSSMPFGQIQQGSSMPHFGQMSQSGQMQQGSSMPQFGQMQQGSSGPQFGQMQQGSSGHQFGQMQ